MDDSHLCPSPSQPSLAAIPPTRTLFSSPLPQSSSSHSTLFTSIYPQGEVPLPFFLCYSPPLRRLPLLSLLVLRSSSFPSLSGRSSPPPFFPLCNLFQFPLLPLSFSPSRLPLFHSPPPSFLSASPSCAAFHSSSSSPPFFLPSLLLPSLHPLDFVPGVFLFFGFFAACLTHSFTLTDCVYIDILSSVHGTAMAQKPPQRIRTMHSNKKKSFPISFRRFSLSPSEKKNI